jgi:TonB family protein
MASERERASKEGRDARPLREGASLLTDLLDPESRPVVSPGLAMQANRDETFWALTKIHVTSQGTVSEVEILRSSGIDGFDERLVAKIKTWKYAPATLNCAPVPSEHEFRFQHRFAH